MTSDFSNKLAGQAIGNWATQQSRYAKDLALIKSAPDDPSLMYQRSDPMVAWEGVKQSMISAAGTMGGELAKSLAGPMDDLAKAIGGYTEKIKGFLDANPGITKAISDHPIATLGGAAATGATVLGGAIWGASRLYRGAAAVGDAGLAAIGGVGRAGLALAAPAAIPFGVAGAGLLASTGPAGAGEDERARQRLHSGLPLFASGAPGPVMAQLNGQAQIGVSLSIDAPPELLSLIRSGVSTTAIGDLRPDTGVSMPEASPSQGGRNGASR